MHAPIPFHPDLESIAEDEQATVDSLNTSFDHILETTRRDYGHAVRGVHAKAHGIMKGTFTVDVGLPDELAQGLFATAGTHPAWVRLSTNPGDILDDAIALPRGLALKIGDVVGERLPGAEGATQDFIMINGPAFLAPTADKFAGSLKLLAGTTDRGEGAKKVLSAALQAVNHALGWIGIESPTLMALGGAKQVDPLGETYYSATPYRFGAYVAKYRLRPVSPSLTALTGTIVDTADNRDAIRAHVRKEMAALDGDWAFEVQLLRNADRQPVEDASVQWSEEVSPFQRVATLHLAAQDSWDEALVREVNEEMHFTVWTGLAAHQPLGSINRARRATYAHSARFRATANGCPMHEPV